MGSASGSWALGPPPALALESACFLEGVIPSVKKLFPSGKGAPWVWNLGHSF